ncbi:MAG TPA: serine/threonine-protein kinase [Gemmataceae bacterium]
MCSASLDGQRPAIDGYEILGELGRGGMGVVYKVRQAQPNRFAALKMLLPELPADKETLARFRIEVEAAARLQHPCIVHIYQVGEHQGRPFYSMEYVEGGSLAQQLAATPNTSCRQAAELVEILARAIHFAHRRGVIHRDLKPGNVLLTADGAPKITDFGLAKLLEGIGDGPRSEATSGAVLGTPWYMAPEQAEGRPGAVGPATDIHALGAILYRILTGRPPFWGVSTLDILEQVRSLEPVSPSRLQPKVPRDLETICVKCLHKEPAKRYASAEELAEDLDRFLQGQPILARPASPVERAARWVRRRPALAALFLLSAVSLLSLLALGSWYASRLREAAQTAEELREHAEQLQHLAEDRERRVNRYLYAADLNLAYLAWDNADVRLTHELLRRHHNHGGREVSPDFPWRYLWRLCRSDRLTLTGHDEDVYFVAFSPDGKTLVTTSKDKTARLWDAATGKAKATLKGHDSEVNGAAFTPDGQTLFTVSDDGTVRQWDAATGRERAVLREHQGKVLCLALSPDGRVLASGGDDRVVRRWDVETGVALPPLKGHTGVIECLAFTPDGNSLAGGSSDKTAMLWDLACGQQQQTFRGHTSSVLGLAVAPDGRTLATASEDHTVRLWDLATGQERAVLRGHSDRVESVAFAPDGSTLVSVSKDTTVRVWDGQRELHVLRGHEGRVWRAAFSPEGRWLATASGDRTIKIWDPRNRQGPRLLVGSASHAVDSLAFAPDGRSLAVGDGGVVTLWDVTTGRLQGSYRGGDGAIRGLTFSPDGTHLAAAGQDGNVRVWDVATQSLRWTSPHRGGVNYLAFAPDGELLASGGDDGCVALWKPATGARRFHLRGEAGPVNALAFSPDGLTLASVTTAQSIQQWSVTSGQLTRRWTGHAGSILSLAISPDGRTLVTGGADNAVKLWDVEGGGERTNFLGHDAAVTSVAFSSDGRTLATGSRDKTVRLWDVATGRALMRWAGHRGRVYGLAFSPDGKTLATAGEVAGEGGEVYLWRTE